MMRQSAATLLPVIAAAAFPALADITGKAGVIDGDTIEIDASTSTAATRPTRVRLAT